MTARGALPLAQLTARGIAPSYVDQAGRTRTLTPAAARELLAAMGDDGPVPPPAVLVTGPDDAVAAPPGRLHCEDGTMHDVRGRLPTALPLGYHELETSEGTRTTVIVSPGRCPAPPARIWGWAAQLYAVTSAASWGVGDLADLRSLGQWSSQVGARVVLVNPLDAVVGRTPRPASPYMPSSRRFLDRLYLRIEDVPGAEVLADRRDATQAALRDGDGRIDRDTVIAAKDRALAAIFAEAPGAGAEPGFAAFRTERGPALERFATFEALAEVHGPDWRRWPEGLRDPHAPEVAGFAAAHADRVRFHAWVQWQLDRQLGAAAAAVPLMRDLPIGVDPAGADAWEWQDLLADGISVGAPPDDLGPDGQDWGVPAFVPHRLRGAAYRPFVETVRAAFRHAAALRIDHVLGLFRLFWVPSDGPAEGAYVHQDRDALFAILALEAHRAGAYVVGEDLGTVGPGVREELTARGLLRYRVFWFEEEPPTSWGASGLAAVSTHDLPSVGGVWSREELDVQRELGRTPDRDHLERMRSTLAGHGGLPDDASVADACVAAAELIGSAGCDVAVVQLEDAVGATHRINVPGTDQQERPANWSRTLPVRLDDLPQDPTARRVTAAMRTARPPDAVSRPAAG